MKFLSIFLAFSVGACVTVPAGSPSGIGIEFGLIALHRSPPQQASQAVVVSRLGGWAGGDGIGLGYAKSKTVQIDQSCHVVFLIENEEQLQRSIDLVNSTMDNSGGDICVTG